MKTIAASAALALSAVLLTGCGDGRSTSDINSAASVLAHEDGNDANGDSYAQALTTLNGRCTQTPDELAVDAGVTQDALKAAGDSETRLAILQSLVKVANAAADKGKVDCEALLNALTAGVKGGG